MVVVSAFFPGCLRERRSIVPDCMAPERSVPWVLQGLTLVLEERYDLFRTNLEVFNVENVARDVENGRFLLVGMEMPDCQRLKVVEKGALGWRVEDGMLVQRFLGYPAFLCKRRHELGKKEDAYRSSRPDSLS